MNFIEKDLPASALHLIEKLSQSNNPDNDTVSRIVSEIPFSRHDFEPFSNYNHPIEENYGRCLLFGNRQFEIFLMSWSAGDFTAIHNHGDAEWGCVRCFGETTHRQYVFKNEWLELSAIERFSNGQVVPVCGQLIHMMGNSGPAPLLTLHIYGRNTGLNGCPAPETLFIPERQCKVITNGPAFVTLLRENSIEIKPFHAICKEAFEDYLKLQASFYNRIGRADIPENALKQILTT